MIRTDDLELVALQRVDSLPMAAIYQLVMLLAEHLKTHSHVDHATFLLLADEARAVTS